MVKVQQSEHREEASHSGDTPGELDYDKKLFQLLRKKRKELADAAEVPPYIIFPDATLIEMAYYFPLSKKSMKTIHGVGAAKLKKYGAPFGMLIQSYCADNNIEERRKTGSTSSAKRSRNRGQRRHHVIGKAYNNGQSIEALRQEYDVKTSTILKHLRTYANEGNPLRQDGLLKRTG